MNGNCFCINMCTCSARNKNRTCTPLRELVPETSASTNSAICPLKHFRGCSSVGRALRSQCRGREFESHQLHQYIFRRCRIRSPWGYGGMVDAEDLKSFGHCDRVGSSPTIPTKLIGCVAQLVRALRSHRRGRRFESAHIHHKKLNRQNADFIFFW